MGASLLTNSVTVNGNTAYRNQEYYRQQIPANNGSSALWTNIIVSGGQSVTGNVYVAAQPETFMYDADGNLTNDGRWAYTWDGENRLTKMVVNTNVGPQYTLAFAYDPKGRRIQKVVITNGVTIYTDNFLYDSWNLISTLNSSLSLLNSYVWGNDLSGSLQKAGGVGGLLEVSYQGFAMTNCFPAYDGNGNVTALVNAADGTLAANFDYGPFGEPIRMTGAMAKNDPFRFSTKYDDDEDDLLYYGYRYYKPSTGAWLSRDPLGEAGFNLLRTPKKYSVNQCQSCKKGTSMKVNVAGGNIYNFVNDDPLTEYDTLGTTPGMAIGYLIDAIMNGLEKTVKTGGPIALCRCAGCLAAIDEQLGACAVYTSGDDWVECICSALKNSKATKGLCVTCAFGGNPINWVRNYIGCDSIGD